MSTPRTLVPIGDPNGIGPEIAVGAVARKAERVTDYPPVLVGDPFIVDFYAQRLGMTVRETIGTAKPISGVVDLLPVHAMGLTEFRPGEISAAAGRATVEYVKTALKAVNRGFGSGIVAAPHSETAINLAGIPFSGYPSLLKAYSGTQSNVFLMLIIEGLRIAHATLHCSVQDALRQLDRKLVEEAIRATHDSLVRIGVDRPRIGVFGINPHAGEGGLFGEEDAGIVAPVVDQMNLDGFNLVGPKGCDVLLADRMSFDGFVAMFHDQGHAPVKALGGRRSSAVCIGADVLFTSVGHGAAFDIAGHFQADSSPLVGAIELISVRGNKPLNAEERQSV